jgi:branched-chain amino acid transport system ATP-binding protein
MLDEPTTGLAPKIAQIAFEVLDGLKDAGMTLLIAEQQVPLALSVADRGYVLENGRITAEGEAAALLDNAVVQDAYLGGSGGSVRAMEQRIRAKRREIMASMGRSA